MSLKLLDLSVIKLGDQYIATVLSIVQHNNMKYSLERIYVLVNNIVEGEKVKRVFRTYMVEFRQSQLSGLTTDYYNWFSSLTWLNVSSNNLGYGTLAI